MNKWCFVFLTVLFFVYPLSGAGNGAAWESVVIKVIDGDSLVVKRDGKTHEIRLYGIDTPEYRQPFSNKAKQLTRKLALDRTVYVEEKDLDRYGRIVALVQSGEKLVNRELVREGLAWFYPQYCHEQPLCSELQKLEATARLQRRGLWRDDNPVSPWDWKRKERSTGSKTSPGGKHGFLDWLKSFRLY